MANVPNKKIYNFFKSNMIEDVDNPKAEQEE